MRIHPSCWLLSALVAIAGGDAQAQTTAGPQRFELERLTLNPSAGASLVAVTGDALEVQQYRLGLLAHYQHRPLVVYRDSGELLGAVVSHRVSVDLLAAWAPFSFLELGLHLPVIVSQPGDTLSSLGLASPDGVGLATPLVYARWAALRQSAGGPMDLSVQLGLGLPVGAARAFASDGVVSVVPRVGAGRSFGLLRVGADVGFEVRPTRSLGGETLGHALTAAVTLSTTGRGLRGELTGRAAFSVGTSAPTVGDVLLGVRYPLGPVELFALGGPGLGAAMGNPVFRVLAGLAFQPSLVPPAPPPQPPPPPVSTKPACTEADAARVAECPELDLDQDGVKNGVDACPDVRGGAAFKGCPVPDTDGDGVNDDVDACPAVAGVESGCPPKDSDGDGVADANDVCPSESGPGTADGCPVKKVVVERSRLRIAERIQFETGSAALKPVSEALLDTVAEVLKAHPEIDHLSIEGHTDGTGGRAFNVKLSLRRAEAVKAALVRRGLQPGRFSTAGKGPDQPLADDATAAGREQNRRVEFHFETEVTP